MSTDGNAGLSLRLSLTDRCQLKCLYCVPGEGIVPCDESEMLTFEEIASFVSLLHSSFGLTKVRFTGGEPLLRQGVEQLIKMIAALGIPDLAMTTNGLALGRNAALLREAGLLRVNVSLDSLNSRTYRLLSRGGNLNTVMAGIRAAKRCGLSPVKVNMVVMRGVNDSEVCDFVEFGRSMNCEVRFLELMPIGEARRLHSAQFVPVEEIRQRLLEQYELVPLQSGGYGTSRRCEVVDKAGVKSIVGFVSPCSAPFCEGCRKLRLTAGSRLIGCLASEDGVDVRPLLRPQVDVKAVEAAVGNALGFKKSPHLFARRELMGSIGG